METSSFIYVTYIAALPDKVFKALIDPKATKKYWQHENVSDWKPGSEMLKGIIEGWPMVLSSLKSLMETGHALPVLWDKAA